MIASFMRPPSAIHCPLGAGEGLPQCPGSEQDTRRGAVELSDCVVRPTSAVLVGTCPVEDGQR